MFTQSDWLVPATQTPMTRSRVETGSNILVVDPDGHQQTSLLHLLAEQNIVVHAVGSAQDAWMCIALHKPQAILIEIALVDDSGFDLCWQLQQSSQTNDIPVLFLGSGKRQRDRLQAFEVGAVDFIAKPYCPEEVIARLQVHINRGKTRQKVRHHTRQALTHLGYSPLLPNLQRKLHQQTVRLNEQNAQLQKEIHERQEIEQALRQEQQKSEQLLLNILPEAIVTQLKQFQGSLAERFEDATVLFADIVDFTPLAVQYSPLELVNLLNQIFSAFDRLAEKYCLEKIKTIGDAYMVVGGVPVPLENHAASVADMALEMQSVIWQFSRNNDSPLQLRIGINTGTVVAGVIGIKKFSYDLWGDTVNVASRMESQGRPGKIQVTATTYDRLKSQFQFEPAQTLEVKGKGLMKTYYLLGRL